MIRPQPTTIAGRILRALARDPGQDVEALARSLFQPPGQLPPPPVRGDAAARLAWLDARRRLVEARDEWERETLPVLCRQVSRTLGRLVEAGLVERAGPPVLAAWALDAVRELDAEGIAAWIGERRRLDADVPEEADDYDPATGGICPPPDSASVAVVRALVAGDVSTALFIRARSGAGERAYYDLVDLGVIVPPSARYLTAAGREVVAGWA